MSGIVSKNGGRSSGIVGAGAIGADAVDGSNIADDAIDSEHYAAGSIDEAHIADNAVTLAKMAGNTDGVIITFDASGDPVAVGPGTDGQVLTSTGAGSPPAFEAVAAGLTLGTEIATTSGTTHTFSSIPSGTKLIFVNFVGCSLNGAGNIGVKLGDSGGIESSGYTESSMAIDNNDSQEQTATGNNNFGINLDNTSDTIHGIMILTLEDASAFTWCETHLVYGDSAKTVIGGGSKSLSAELTQLQLMGGTFDAGAVNISYI